MSRFFVYALLGIAVLCTPAFAATPANDNIANAIDLGSVSSFASTSTNVGATKEVGEPTLLQAGLPTAGETIWWKWTNPSTATRRVQIDTNGSTNAVRFGIFRSAVVPVTFPSLTVVTTNGNTTSTIFNATAGTAYYVVVDSPTLATPTGNVNLNLIAQPNDNFASAALLTHSETNVLGSTVNATRETGEPNHGGNLNGASVWYTFTASVTRNITISNNGLVNTVTTPTALAVYTGSAVNALTTVSQSVGANTTNSLKIAAVAGTTYYIAVDGGNAAFGSFKLSLTPAPVNDDFAARITVSGTTFSVAGTTIGATTETGEPAAPNNSTVWYTWTAPATVNVAITTGDFDPNSQLTVYTGTTVAGLTSVGSAAGTVTVSVSAGTVYQIRVDGGGNFILAALAVPPNDNFGNAITLSGAFDVEGYTYGATTETGEPVTLTKSVWYKWTAPADMHVSLKYNDGFGGAPQVFTGTTVSALTAVTKSATDVSTFTFDAVAGTAYFIAIGSGLSGVSGEFELALRTGPANDNFANAIAITGVHGKAIGNNYAASKETGEPNHDFKAGGQSVWYSWTPPNTGIAAIAATGDNFLASVGVYSGTSVGALTRLTSGSAAGVGGTAGVSFNVVQGTVYMIAVDGTGSGDLSVLVAVSPANDDFANAFPLSGTLPITTTGDNVLATVEPGEPNHSGNAAHNFGHSVWWSYTATETRLIEVNTTGSDTDTALGIYTGSSVSTLTLIANNDDTTGLEVTSLIQFNAVAGTTYFIAVDGNQGDIVLTVSQATIASTSALSASPTVDEVGRPVSFVFGANATAEYTWNFGDGSTSVTTVGAINHTYTTAGVFTVTVTAAVLNGTSVTSSVTITILPHKDLVITKGTITLGAKPGTDVITLAGGLAVTGSTPATSIVITVGPFTKTYTLTKSMFKSKTETVKVTLPKTSSGTAKFTATLKGDFAALFAPLGLTKTPITNSPVQIPVQIIFNGVVYDFTLDLLYSYKGTKGGAK